MKPIRQPSPTARRTYTTTVSLLGAAALLWALLTIHTSDNLTLLPWLLLLTVLTTTLAVVSRDARISFSVSHAVALATVLLVSLAAGLLVVAVDALAMWLLNTIRKQASWRGTVEQLTFNGGMIVLSTLVSGFLLFELQQLWDNSLIGAVISWAIAAVVQDQVNLWLVSIVIYLQSSVNPLAFVRAQLWALPTNILSGGIGGSLLTAGALRLGVVGLLLLLLPLLLLAVRYREMIYNVESVSPR